MPNKVNERVTDRELVTTKEASIKEGVTEAGMTWERDSGAS